MVGILELMEQVQLVVYPLKITRRVMRSRKLRFYVETSVINNLANRPALDVITAGHQATTLQWWDKQRPNYELVISQFVVDEAGEGGPIASANRTASLAGILRLDIDHLGLR